MYKRWQVLFFSTISRNDYTGWIVASQHYFCSHPLAPTVDLIYLEKEEVRRVISASQFR